MLSYMKLLAVRGIAKLVVGFLYLGHQNSIKHLAYEIWFE